MSEIINKVVPIDAISPHEDNYNNHPETQLVQLGASYDDLDQFQSVVIWQRPGNTYIQVAGHGVVEAMQRKGALYVRADILPEDTDPLKVKRIMVASNLHAKNSIPDDTMLAQLLQEQQDAGFDLAALGTDDETLRQMLANLGDSYLGNEGNPDVQFKEYDETIADDLDTEMCKDCGKLCLKGKGKEVNGRFSS